MGAAYCDQSVGAYGEDGRVENYKGDYNQGVAKQGVASHEESSEVAPTTPKQQPRRGREKLIIFDKRLVNS